MNKDKNDRNRDPNNAGGLFKGRVYRALKYHYILKY